MVKVAERRYDKFMRFLLGFMAGLLGGGAILGGGYFLYSSLAGGGGFAAIETPVGIFRDAKKEKTPEELLAEALEKSSQIKGLYMTADVASGAGPGPEKLRNYLIGLATSTEINGLVIDVKEVCGPDYDEERIKKLLAALKKNNIWAIARIVVFKDHSQIEAHPEWYLKRRSAIAVGNECWNKRHLVVKNGNRSGSTLQAPSSKLQAPFWRDKRGGYWLDPAHPGAREYILEFSKKMIDLGFDELQFDYIRFPSDGDVQNAIYPAWDGKTPKYEVMKSFFEYLNKNLKAYKPDIILSADLFGYAAIRAGDVGIGQRLDDIGDNFDYISFMLYPSHYYSGFYLPRDPVRGLPALNYNRWEARAHPGDIVSRSLLFARDFLDGKISTSSYMYLPVGNSTVGNSTTTGTSSPPAPQTEFGTRGIPDAEIIKEPQRRSRARLRPWLEDFFHEEDKAAGRPWGREKVRLQIEAAESSENHGWLLWNSANRYTEEALKKE